MKKQLLSTALSSLLCFSVHADDTPAPAPAATDMPAAQTVQEPVQEPAAVPAPATPDASAASSMPPAPQPVPVMNCDYPLPATTTTVDEGLISSWAGKAAVQAFDFNPTDLTAQMEKLKTCFTDQGWQGFHDALDKSGNLTAIKTQLLTVSSQVDGDVKVTPVKENQWKVTLPMQVIYKNDKENLTQLLSVDLLIGRKVSGNLGIMQMVATPRDAAASTTAGTPPAAP